MTTVKIGDLLDSVPAMQQLAGMQLPIRLAFRLKKMLKRIQQEVDLAVETKNETLKKYTKLDEAGKPVHPIGADGKPNPQQIELTDPVAYRAELAELTSQEVSMQLDELKPSDFGDNIEIKPAVLLTLHWIFVEE